jgi:hypothetical protein
VLRVALFEACIINANLVVCTPRAQGSFYVRRTPCPQGYRMGARRGAQHGPHGCAHTAMTRVRAQGAGMAAAGGGFGLQTFWNERPSGND